MSDKTKYYIRFYTDKPENKGRVYTFKINDQTKARERINAICKKYNCKPTAGWLESKSGIHINTNTRIL